MVGFGGCPASPCRKEFAAECQRLIALTNGQAAAIAHTPLDKRTYGMGSFGALVSDYLNSAEYKQLIPVVETPRLLWPLRDMNSARFVIPSHH